MIQNMGLFYNKCSSEIIILLNQLFYILPFCNFTGEDLFYHIRTDLICWVIIVYDNCDTIFCDLCSFNTFLCFLVLQVTGCHSDITYTLCCAIDSCCGVADLNLYCDVFVCFLICLCKLLHYRSYGRRSHNYDFAFCISGFRMPLLFHLL